MKNDVLKNWIKKATDEKKEKLITRYEKYISDLKDVIKEVQQKEDDKVNEYAGTLMQIIRETQLKIDIVKGKMVLYEGN